MAELTKEDIKVIQDKMGDFEQFSPLFDDVADEVHYSNVKGDVAEFKLDTGRLVYSLVIKAGKISTRIPLVMGTETKKKWNIGTFTALRDYESARSKFVAGETKRVFAY